MIPTFAYLWLALAAVFLTGSCVIEHYWIGLIQWCLAFGCFGRATRLIFPSKQKER